ncbi:hypothetical protein FCV25MIE_33009, partial [Fagus crenata]
MQVKNTVNHPVIVTSTQTPSLPYVRSTSDIPSLSALSLSSAIEDMGTVEKLLND